MTEDVGTNWLDGRRVVDFDFYDRSLFKADFHTPWKALQDEAASNSLVWTTANGGHWIATRGKLIQQILSQPDRFSSYRMTIAPGGDRSGRWDVLPISLDPPEHARYRVLLNAGLSPRAIRARAEEIRTFAIDLIEGFRPQGRCEFVKEYAEVFPIQMVFNIMDLPIDEKPRMMSIIQQLTSPDGSMTVTQIVDGFSEFLRPFIAARRSGEGSDLITQIATGMIDDRQISEDEAVQLCVQVFAAGLESVRNALSFTMLHLARAPTSRRALAEDASLIPATVNEALRRFSAMIMSREVVADTVVEGVTLRKGDMIAIPAQLAGLDDQENRCPMDFDSTRKPSFSLPFGAGPHFCAGRWLAEFELKVTLEEWMKRIPEFTLETDYPVTFTGGVLGSVDAVPLVW